MTTPGKSDAPLPQPSTIMRVGFWMAVASATLILVGVVLLLTAKQLIIEQEIKNMGAKFTPAQVSQAVNFQLWLSFGFSLVFGLLTGYLARRVLGGHRKSRVWFTVAALLLVLFFLVFGGHLITLVGGVFLLVSIGLLFAPSATQYLKSE